MDVISCWISAVALLASGIIYVHTIELRMKRGRGGNLLLILIYFAAVAVVSRMSAEVTAQSGILLRIGALLFLIFFLHAGRDLSWVGAAYYAIWAFMSWQLLLELVLIFRFSVERQGNESILPVWLGESLLFIVGHIVMAFTIGKWLPEKGKKKIGPRQFSLEILTFFMFQMLVFSSRDIKESFGEWRWIFQYLLQLFLTVILYLENELFKKSEMRRELEVMNLLWKTEQEQYQLSKENIALINQKCHDLKHQIYALRNMGEEERNRYLDQIAESVQIYEAMVKTGNEVLDTILTEKSLHCKKRGITVSCVADGSQMDFIDTIDLYAILGNAIDNAIEAVEKFEQEEKRQIDVLIYRQQQFLAINVINPLKESLVYEDGLPVTTKENKKFHGFGLRSIKYMVKKCGGIMNISEEDGCFSLMILIPIP